MTLRTHFTKSLPKSKYAFAKYLRISKESTNQQPQVHCEPLEENEVHVRTLHLRFELTSITGTTKTQPRKTRSY